MSVIRLRLIMRAYCQEALNFGEQLCPQGATPRHITVIMNSHTKGRLVFPSLILYETYEVPRSIRGNAVHPFQSMIIMSDNNCRKFHSKTLYEEYAAPLLHLAGLKVSLFKTEHSGQAKDLMQIMDNTDAVLVVGGDGTLMEAVTGLLSRDDRVGNIHERIRDNSIEVV